MDSLLLSESEVGDTSQGAEVVSADEVSFYQSFTLRQTWVPCNPWGKNSLPWRAQRPEGPRGCGTPSSKIRLLAPSRLVRSSGLPLVCSGFGPVGLLPTWKSDIFVPEHPFGSHASGSLWVLQTRVQQTRSLLTSRRFPWIERQGTNLEAHAW